MTQDDRFSRRSIVKLTGASAATALIAGCGGPETDNESADQDDGGAQGEGEANDSDTGDEAAPGEGEENETGEVNETGEGNETSEGNETGEGNESEGNETADGEGNESEGNESDGGSGEWQDVEEIELGGDTMAWQGVAPAPIEGEDNPTLELTAGTEYDITWENVDGQPHNILIWDDNEEVVEDYQTEIIEEEGETQTLTFEATEEMAQYVCEVHVGTMIGDIEVQSE